MAIAITVHTTNQTVDPGAVVSLDATITGFISGEDTFTWFEDGFSLPTAGTFSNLAGGIINANSGDGTWTAPSPATQTAYVLSLNAGGTSDSVTITVRAASVTAPGVPTSVSLTTIDHDSVRLTWSAGSGDAATSYQVQTREGIRGNWTNRGTQSSGYTLNGLEADTLYQGRVRATNSAGSSTYSSPNSTTTDEETTTAPPTPTGLSASRSGTTVTVSWNSSSGASHYQLQYWNDVTNVWVNISSTLTSTSYTHSNLNSGQGYSYTVRARNSQGQWSSYTTLANLAHIVIPLSAPALSAVGTDTINATWTSPYLGGSLANYSIRHRQSGTTTWTTSTNVSSNHDIDNLDSDTEYQVQVQQNITGSGAYSGTGTWSKTSTATTDEDTTPTGPAIPGNIRLSRTGEWALSARWNTVSGATRYQLQISDATNNSSTTVTINSGSVAHYQHVQTTINHTYNLQIRTGNATTWGQWSASPGPSATRNRDPRFTLNGVWSTNNEQVELSWSKPGWLNSRYVRRRGPTGYTFGSIHFNASGNPSNHNDQNVTPGQTYEYIIDGITTGFSSRWSTRFQITIPTSTTTAPGAPTSVSVTGDADSRTVTWEPPTSDGGSSITGYRINYTTPGGVTTEIRNLNETNRSWTHTDDLLTSGTYTYGVAARNDIGHGAYGTDTIAIGIVTAPGVPTSVSLTTIDHDSVRLTWSAGSGDAATSYQVQTRQGTSENWTNRGTQSSGYTLNGLEADTLYQGRVRATNSAGSSTYSSPNSTTTDTETTVAEKPEPPINQNASSITAYGFTMSWDPATSGGTPTYYEIRWREGTSGPWTVTTLGNVTQYTFTNLEPDTLYQATARAFNSIGGSDSGSPNFYTHINGISVTTLAETTEAPGTPTSISASGVDQDSINVTWSAPTTGGDAETYSVRYREGTSGFWTTISDISGTSRQIDGLTPNTQHQAQVKADNTAGSSNWAPTNPATATTTTSTDSTEAPTAPRRFQGDARSSGVILRWLTPTATGTGGDITNYNIWRWHEGQWQSITSSVSATATTYTDTANLTINDTYWYAMRAINSSGNGEWSSVIPVVINPSLPSAPRRLIIDAQSDGVKMSWLTPEDSGTAGVITGYNIWRNNGTTWTQIVSDTNSTSTTYTDTATLTIDATYSYAIRAINSDGPGEWSETTNVVINPSLPSAPRRLTAIEFESNIKLTWLAPADTGLGGTIIGYSIHRHDGTSWSTLSANTGSTTRQYTDTSSRTTGLTYTYAVRAINNAGSGEWSETASWSDADLDQPEPSAPRRVQADAQSTGVVMTWLVPSSSGTGGAISGYNIWRGHADVWTEIVANTGNTNLAYTDTATLIVGDTYWYTLRAINPSGNGEWSETSSAVINPDLPSAPRRFVGDAQSTGVVLSWLAPADTGLGGDVTGYNIWRWYDDVWTEIVVDTGNTNLVYTDTATLVVGKTYWYTIRATNGSGNGEWAETTGVVINPSIPSAPRRLVGDAQSSGVVLAWLAPVDEGLGGDITGYNIWRWHANVWTEIVADTSNTDTEYTDTTNLTVGDTYWYTLRAINAEGGGEWAETTGVVINPSLPSAPRRLIVSEGTTGIVLNWLVPIDTGLGGVITGYNIWRWDEVGGWLEIVDDTASTALTYIDTSTLDEGWHHYAVRAINASGEGEWSETSGVTTATNVPGPPQSLFAIDTASGIELSWTAPADDGGAPITGYRIWRSDGVDWTELVTDTGSVDTIYVDTMVKSIGDGIYFYRVQALTINGIGDFSAVASIQITGLLSVVMPTRSDNRVFGNWWVSLIPDVTNPNNDILLYEWSQDGGIIVSLTDSKDTYIKFPDGIDIDKNVSATLSITNIVTNYQIIDTIDFVVVAEPDRASLFYHGTTNEIPGVAWYKWAQIREDLDSSNNPTGDVGLVDSRLHETRAYVKISDENVLHTPAYVGLLTMKKNGTLLFNLAETPDDPGYGASPNPQLTDYAETNFGLALQLPNGNQYKWGFDDLTDSDTLDPYTFSSSSVSTAGQANNQSFRNALLDFWNARLVIVDRTSSFVDWVNLELIAINPSVSIDVVDTTADSESTQTISGLFDDFRNEFEEIGIMVETTSGTLGVLDRDDVSGFWSIPWSAPVVSSGTESSTITIIVENTFNRETEDSATILTRSTFQPIFPDNLVVSDIISIKPEDELKDVTNVVTVPVRQFDVTGEIELWSLQESIELGPEELRSFLITYPDDAAPRSHLAVNNWTKLRLREDPEFVFGPTPNTFGSKGGEVDEARRTRNLYAEQTPVWADEYKNSSSLIVKLLGSSRSGEVYEAYSKGEWVEVSPIFPDYAANSQSDGNGDDRTNDLEIEVDDGGNTRRLIVKNSHTSDTIFLTTLRSRGRIIQEIQKATIEIRNESSVNAYGVKNYRSESQFLSTFDQAHEYGTHVLYLYSEPVLKIKVRFQANDALFLTYSLKLSDRVALTREGETEEYFVEAIEHFIEEGLRHDMQLTLSSAPPGNVIILGTGPALGEGTLGR